MLADTGVELVGMVGIPWRAWSRADAQVLTSTGGGNRDLEEERGMDQNRGTITPHLANLQFQIPVFGLFVKQLEDEMRVGNSEAVEG